MKFYRRTASGTSTPSGMQTPRKGSMEPPTMTPTPRKKRGSTPSDQKAPFRLQVKRKRQEREEEESKNQFNLKN